MSLLKFVAALLGAFAFVPTHVWASSLLGPDLATFSVLSGSYVTYGADAVIGGRVGAATYITAGANATSGGDVANNPPEVQRALTQLATAQAALNNMGAGKVLLPTVSTDLTLAPGVYSASALTIAASTKVILDGGGTIDPTWVFNIDTYLVTGDSAEIRIVNAGTDASVVWNTGGYTTLGANTTFLGTILSKTYISQGAGAAVTCGAVYSNSYISIPAGGKSASTNCAPTDTWAGSVKGLASNLMINDQNVAETASPVPEPHAYALLLAGFLVLFSVGKRRSTAARQA